MNPTPGKTNPFPGLRPFSQEEDYLFFGREEQTLELLQRLSSNRFVAVVGSSGSGKSSLVRCGLLSELLGGRMLEAGASWEIAVTHPGGNPLAILTDALLDADLYDRAAENARENLLATLSRSHFGLVEAVKQADLGVETNFLLVVDQFEEIFRFHEAGQTQQEAANEFVSLLLEAAAQKEVPIYVVLTMRSDFIGECGQFEGLAEMVNRGEFLIPRLNREQYKRVIEGPIKVAGGQIAPRLLQRLLNDLGQQADQLPCLQHALMRTWDVWATNGTTDALDFNDYQCVGRMSQALSLHADEVYASLASDRQRDLCRGIFQALTIEESNSRGIRRPQRLGRLCQILDVPAQELLPVINAYRQSGVTFLMPSPEVELTEQTIIDISHESLMRVWTRLRQWVEEETQAAGIYHRLAESADLHARGKAGLYRDPELGIALAWQAAKSPNAAWAERYRPGFARAMTFLEASEQASAAEEQLREAVRQRELQQAQKLAEVQQLQLEQQQRSARGQQKLIFGLAIVAIVAVAACIVALISNQRANDLASIAREKTQAAETNAADALSAQKATEAALAQVESQKSAVESSLSKAEQAEEASRKLLYTTDMRLAPFVWSDDRTTAQKLRTLLAKHVPEAGSNKSDLRGFEWHYFQHLLDHSAAVFAPHTDTVVSSAFTPNGQLLTLDRSGQIRRWDLNSQVEDEASRRDSLKGDKNAVRVLSPNGQLAAILAGPQVQVFETSSGKRICEIASTDVREQQLLFSPDSSRMVILDDKIRWCDAASGQVLGTHDQKFDRITSLALSADGLTLAVVGHGNLGNAFTIFRFDPGTKNVAQHASNNTGGTKSASALSPDGKLLAVGLSLSGPILLFDTTTGRVIAQHASAHAASISAMTFSADGTKLVSADVEGMIKVWEDPRKLTSKMTAMMTLKGHEGPINEVRLSVSGKQLVSSSADKSSRVWDLTRPALANQLLEGSGGSTHVARFSPDGNWIAAQEGNRVRLWDAATGRLVWELPADKRQAYSVAFSPTDRRLLAVGYGGDAESSQVVLWDIDSRSVIGRFDGVSDQPGLRGDVEYAGVVGALVFSPDGKYLVAGFGSPNLHTSAVSPNPLKVWEVGTRRLIRRLNGHTGFCVSLAFSGDGTQLASGSRDGTAILWSTETWKALHTLRNPDRTASNVSQAGRGMVDDVAFSPDGRVLAMTSREGSVHLWNADDGKLLETLKGHSSAVEALAFSPDGRTLATGGGDQTVRLWNVETRRELLQLDFGSLQIGMVDSLSFSPDGKQLLAAGRGIAFWSIATNIWNAPEQAAKRLQLLRQSKVDFPSRMRMLSENLGVHAALQKLDSQDRQIQASLAAAQANWQASRGNIPEAVSAYDHLVAIDPVAQNWLGTPGLLRLAAALLQQNRPVDAAALLTGGAKRRAAEGLPAAINRVGLGATFATASGKIVVIEVLAGHLSTSSGLRAGDVILKVNDTGVSKESLENVVKLLSGEAGTKIQLTVQRAGSDEPLVIEQAREQFIQDAVTGDLLHPLHATINARLAQTPSDPGLHELRAELAGQWADAKAQVADYTVAIDALKEQSTKEAAESLSRLYGRRGNALVELKQWPEAVADFARCVTSKTTDDELLANQAAALAAVEPMAEAATAAEDLSDPWQKLALVYELNGKQLAIDQSVDLRPQLAGRIGAAFIKNENWSRAVEIISRGIQAAPADIELLSNRARAYEGLQNWNAAAADWSLATKGNPDGAKLLAEFSRRLPPGETFGPTRALRQTAQQLFEAILRADPGDVIVAEQLADLLLDASPVDRARLINVNDKLVPWLPLAVGYAANGETALATKYFLQALSFAEGLDDERPVVQAASRSPSILSELQIRRPNDPLLQLAMARSLAEQSQRALSKQRFPEAQLALEHSRDHFTRFFANHPPTQWTVVQPKEVKSAGGATFTWLADSSTLVGGPNPDQDTYTIQLQPNLAKVAAIRLNTLAHESLLDQASGRSGNFNLTGVTVLHNGETIKLSSAWVDHSDRDSGGAKDGAEGIIDASDFTHWSVSPLQSEPHVALLQLEKPLDLSGNATLTIQLHFQHRLNLRHSIGRFRLSLSDDLHAVESVDLQLEMVARELAEVHAALGMSLAQQGKPDAAVAALTEAFKLGDDRHPQSHYAAERAAAASTATEALDDSAKARLRALALQWLRADLTGWSKLLESAPPQDRLSPDRLLIVQMLSRWQLDRDLAAIRDADALAKLPAAEQAAFKQLWADVSELLAKADGGFRSLPANEQVAEVGKALKNRNPKFNGQLKPKIENGKVTGLQFLTDDVLDIAPVIALVHLQSLDLHGTYPNHGLLFDLSPLQGLPLQHLDVCSTRVTDLTALQGMPLKQFFCSHTSVADLSPLQGAPLTHLEIASCQVADLFPLRGMRLTKMMATNLPVRDLSPLTGMPLTGLDLHETRGVSSLQPLRGMPLVEVNLTAFAISDLAVFQGSASLRMIVLNRTQVTDASLDQLKGCRNLASVRVVDTKVTAAGIAELKKALPKCSVE